MAFLSLYLYVLYNRIKFNVNMFIVRHDIVQVDPVIINAGTLGFGSDTLMNFTLVPYSTPQCGNIGELDSNSLYINF